VHRHLPLSICGWLTDAAFVLSRRSRDDDRTHAPSSITGYGNIATAVSAAKIGAVDYLTKPTDADEIVTVLLTPEDCKPEPPKHPMTADRVRWEHIQNIYQLCGRNVSEAARRLTMHRRTLQRVLAKGMPR
jgi:two-component system, response regulator RegA